MALVGFVPEPNCGRGTYDIIINCFFTVVFSTWTILHANVDQRSLKSRLGLSLFIFLAPEFMVLEATNDWWYAQQLKTAMHPTWPTWTLKQSFAINMGAVRLFSPRYHETTHNSSANDSIFMWALRYIGLASQIPDTIRLEEHPELMLNLEQHAHVLPGSIYSYPAEMRRELVKILPSDKEIDMRSKTDGFLKLLALFQALAFLARNIVWRLVSKVEISLLEVATLSYLICAFVMFMAHFKKPQGLEDPFDLHLKSEQYEELWSRFSSPQKRSLQDVSSEIRNGWYFFLTFLVASGIVAVHLGLTWNTEFPTVIEDRLWKGANFACLGYGLFLIFVSRCIEGRTLAYTLRCLYCAFRLYFIAQCFASFRASPISVYEKPKSDWTIYWPHFGA